MMISGELVSYHLDFLNLFIFVFCVHTCISI